MDQGTVDAIQWVAEVFGPGAAAVVGFYILWMKGPGVAWKEMVGSVKRIDSRMDEVAERVEKETKTFREELLEHRREIRGTAKRVQVLEEIALQCRRERIESLPPPGIPERRKHLEED